MKTRRPYLLLIGLVGVIALLRVALALHFDLFVDEAIYYYMARCAPLTFTPHPPGVPWMIDAGLALAGHRELGIRLGSLLLGTLFPFAAWILARKFVDKTTAAWSTAFLAAVPVYVAFGIVTTPDMPQLFLWTAILILTWNALESERSLAWIAVGIFAALALAVKYVGVLYFPSLALYLVLTGQWRHEVRRPGIWIMGVTTGILMIGLILLVGPVTFLDSIRYHLSERQDWKLPSPKGIALNQLAHLAYFSPLLYLGALAGTCHSGITGFRERDRSRLYLFAFAFTPWIFFTIISAFTERVLNREHWDSPAYVTAIVAGTAFVRSYRPGRTGKLLLSSALGIALVALLITVTEAFAGLPGRWFHLGAPFTSLHGWKTFSERIDRKMETMPPRSFIMVNSFPLMVEHSFYSTRHDPLYTLPSGRDRKFGIAVVWDQARSSEAWLPAQQGRDGLFVHYDDGQSDLGRENVDNWIQNLHYRFDAIGFAGNGSITFENRVIRSYFFLHGKRLKPAEHWMPPVEVRGH